MLYIKDKQWRFLSKKYFLIHPWYHSQRQETFFKKCKFLSEKRLSETETTKVRKKYPYFSLTILYIYKSQISPLPFYIWDISYVYKQRTLDDWQWSVGRVQLKCDFLSEYESIHKFLALNNQFYVMEPLFIYFDELTLNEEHLP